MAREFTREKLELNCLFMISPSTIVVGLRPRPLLRSASTEAGRDLRRARMPIRPSFCSTSGMKIRCQLGKRVECFPASGLETYKTRSSEILIKCFVKRVKSTNVGRGDMTRTEAPRVHPPRRAPELLSQQMLLIHTSSSSRKLIPSSREQRPDCLRISSSTRNSADSLSVPCIWSCTGRAPLARHPRRLQRRRLSNDGDLIALAARARRLPMRQLSLIRSVLD